MTILLSDIGGTNIRFSLLSDNKISEIEYFKTADFFNIETVLSVYLKNKNIPQKMIFGVAGLVTNGYARLTNADFEINQQKLEMLYPHTKIKIVNDFILQGYGVLQTENNDLREIGKATIRNEQSKIVLGPGTGLGSCFLIPNESDWSVLSSESGHTTLAPISANQQKILAFISKNESPLSFEDVISGSGLCRLYQAVLQIQQLAPDSEWIRAVEDMKKAFSIINTKEASFVPLMPKEITKLAEDGEEVALLTFWYFFEFLGIYASNLALTIKSEGGVYLVGSLLNQPFIKHLLLRSNFRKYFNTKGVFSDFMKNIPVFLVEKPHIQIDGLIYLSKNT